MSNTLAFMAAALIAIVVPGPDFVVVIRNAITRGRVAGFFTGLGICTALMVHGVAAALGLSALLATSATAFIVVKFVGAAYLGYLGVRALMAVWRSGAEPDAKPTLMGPPATVGAAYRQGVFTNLLNPKAALFFLSFLPQFLPDNGSMAAWTAGYVAILIAMSFVWWSSVAVVASTARSVLQRQNVRRTFDGVTGGVFVGLAAKLALTHR